MELYMLQNQHIINALPLVADVLGRKYGVRVHIGGRDAYTDGRDIYLPSLPLDCDDTTRNLVRAFIDHESGHLRDTDFEALAAARLAPLEHHIFNILEDWRVEQRMAALFPGCRHNLTWLIRHMFLKPEPRNSAKQPANPAVTILNWLLYAVRAWDVPELGSKRDRAAKEIETNYPGLILRLSTLADTVPGRCATTGDCVAAAREIVLVLKQYLADLPQEKRKKSQTDSQCANEPADQQDTDETGAKAMIPNGQLQELLASVGTELPDDVGAILAKSLAGLKAPQSERLQVAVCTGKQKLPFHPSAQDDARRATTALRTRLQALLQSQVYVPSRAGYRGRLDTQRLHRLFTGNPRIFRKHAEKQGVDTAVHILLDCSGSMGGAPMILAGHACFAVASALHAIPGVNVAVTAFPGDRKGIPGTSDCWKTVAPIMKHGERLHGEFSLAANGDTPLGEALWWVMQQMQPLNEPRKIVLIITDGHPDSVTVAQGAIRTGTAIGYEIYGIGIGENSGIHEILPASSMTILALQELASAMFAILSKSLLNNPSGLKFATNQN